ncbi:DUF6075 family protein [Clostridium celatum]|uniref:DUF6075 family protein n=1 Tax=Clostridium celatum TaxID=36834 RepID=UPI00189913C5|nr:DUF6075 family protein [Clostridium celatum]
MKFMSQEHEQRYEELMKRGRGVRPEDCERIPVMYILSGNKDLYYKADDLYDFKKGYFKLNRVEDERGNTRVKWLVPLSSSERVMTTLAFDIFSGEDNVGVHELFRVLDRYNTRLALRTIELAYMC